MSKKTKTNGKSNGNGRQTRADLEAVVLHLQGELRSRSRRVSHLEKQVAAQQVVADAIVKNSPRIAPRPIKPFAIKKSKPKASGVGQLSDWHIGAVVLSEEVGNLPPYNYRVAERRMDQYVDSVSRWLLNRRDVLTITELVLMGLGDWVLGTIHPEFLDTCEFPWPEQILRAGTLYSEVVAALRDRVQLPIRNVFVVPDNHGRDAPKPRAKRRADHSMNTLVLDKIRAVLGEMPDVTWETGKGVKLLTQVQGKGFLCTHGDTIRGWAGIPYYGIKRAMDMENTRRMKNPEWQFDYFTMGHFHHHADLGSIILNGSLQGTDEYDELCGRTSAATQNAFLVSPRHGVFDMTAFDLE